MYDWPLLIFFKWVKTEKILQVNSGRVRIRDGAIVSRWKIPKMTPEIRKSHALMWFISLPTNWPTLVYSETVYCRGIWEKWLLLPRTRSNTTKTSVPHHIPSAFHVLYVCVFRWMCGVMCLHQRLSFCVFYSPIFIMIFYLKSHLKIYASTIIYMCFSFFPLSVCHHLPNHEKPRDFLIRFSTVSCYILSYHFLRFSFFSLALSFILSPCKSKECISLFELHCRH